MAALPSVSTRLLRSAAKRQRRISFIQAGSPTPIAILYQSGTFPGFQDREPKDRKEVWHGLVSDITKILDKIRNRGFPRLVHRDAPFRAFYHLHVILPPMPGSGITPEVHIMTLHESIHDTPESPRLYVYKPPPSFRGDNMPIVDTALEFQMRVEHELIPLKRAFASRELVPDILPQVVYHHVLAPYINYNYRRRKSRQDKNCPEGYVCSVAALDAYVNKIGWHENDR